jgi:hypothetical protein
VHENTGTRRIVPVAAELKLVLSIFKVLRGYNVSASRSKHISLVSTAATVEEACTSVPVHTRRILLPGPASRSLTVCSYE